MKEKYYIYTLTDPLDNEIKYVGKSKDLKNRLSRHMSPYSLKDAWTSKNKWLSWLKNKGLVPIIEVLDEGDLNNIDSLEIYWISQFKSWGYKLKNGTRGGKGCEYWTGKKLSDEHKMNTKMHNPLRREICQYEIGTDRLIGEYISGGEAGKITGIRKDHITSCCRGVANTAGGFYWRYEDSYFPFVKTIVKQSEENKLKSKINNRIRKEICKYEIGTDRLIEEYLSSHDAEKHTKIDRNHICKCCRGVENYNSAGGFYWRYKNDYFLQKENKSKDHNKKFYSVEKYDKNMNLVYVYDSTFQARKEGNGLRGIKLSSDKNLIYRDYYWKIIEKIIN